MAVIDTVAESNAESSAQLAQSLTSSDVCREFLGDCSAATFWRLRKNDSTFPKPMSLGGHPLYRRVDVQAWFDSKRAEAA